jgi:hypothetical protein
MVPTMVTRMTQAEACGSSLSYLYLHCKRATMLAMYTSEGTLPTFSLEICMIYIALLERGHTKQEGHGELGSMMLACI